MAVVRCIACGSKEHLAHHCPQFRMTPEQRERLAEADREEDRSVRAWEEKRKEERRG